MKALKEKNNFNKKRLLFILPSLIIVTLLTYLPLVYTFILSLFTGRGNNLKFGGISNYIKLIDDHAFKSAFGNSLIFTLLLVPSIIIISYLVALLLNNIENNKFQNFFTAVLYIPCITSPIAYSLFFKQLAYSDGILSKLLGSLSFIPDNFDILQNPWSARIYIILICLWAWSGYFVLIFLTAMKSINPNLYKAAKIDGASKFKVATKIILPSIKPVFILILVLVTCSSFQMFVETSIITKGGPNMTTYTLVNYLYNRAFTYVSQYGYSSAVAVIIFSICVIASLRIMKVLKND